MTARAGLFLAAIALHGCSGTPENTDAEAEAAPWVELADGSSLRRDYHDGDVVSVREITRCWPQDARQECIQVLSSSVAAGTLISISRLSVANLAQVDPPPAVDDDLLKSIELQRAKESPYSCEYYSGTDIAVTEAISNDRGLLQEHRLSRWTDEAPWTREYVEAFVRENGLRFPGRSYFDCPGLAKIIDNGSIESLGSTLVNGKFLT